MTIALKCPKCGHSVGYGYVSENGSMTLTHTVKTEPTLEETEPKQDTDVVNNEWVKAAVAANHR
jgi:hypothetical protein